MTRALRFAVLAAGLAFGVFSLAVARRGAGYSLGGGSVLTGAAELIAGYALLAVGLAAWMRPRQARLGAIVVAASFAWFLAGWATPGAGSAVVFTAGLALYAAAPPVVAHAMLAYPDGRVRWWPGRAGLALAYASAVLVLGILAAAVFDPAAEGCAQCPRNLLLVDGGSGMYQGLNRAGLYLGLACSLLLILLAVGGLIRSAPACRRLASPVVAAGCVYLGFVAADYAHSLARGFLGDDLLDRWLWLGQAAALCALSLGVTWAWARARRTRAALARFVIELAGSPSVGGLRDVLAATLRDPSLELAYPLAGGRFADARCRPVELNGEKTPIVRGGRQVALLSHRPGLLTEPALAEVAAAARLVLENERLQAEPCPSSRTCTPRAAGSSRPATPRGAGLDAISMTAPSSGSSRSRSRSAWPPPGSVLALMLRKPSVSTRPKPSCAPPWPTSASWRRGSSRRCSPRKGLPPRSRRWRRRSRSRSRRCPASDSALRWRRLPTSSWPKRSGRTRRACSGSPPRGATAALWSR